MSTAQVIQLLGAVLALVCLGVAIRLCWRRPNFLLPWLRGNLGVLSLVIAALCLSLSIDLGDYQSLSDDRPLAEIRFIEFKPGVYIAKLSRAGREDQSFELHGQQWKLDARIIRWRGGLETNWAPLFRLGSLSGRYLTLQDSQQSQPSIHELGNSAYAIDTWRILHSIHRSIPWVQPQYAKAVYMPMAHDAQFDIAISEGALVARPLNEAAIKAADSW